MVLVVMYVEDIVIAVHNTGANDSEENCCAGVLGRHSRLDVEHQDVQQSLYTEEADNSDIPRARTGLTLLNAQP